MSGIVDVDTALILLPSLAFYGTVIILKVILMAFITAATRFRKKAFANPEDVKRIGHGAKIDYADADVERVRRAHLNDLENIPPFLLLALLYIHMGPNVTVALWHLRLFVFARIFHTIMYVFVQRGRGPGFIVGVLVCFSMVVQILIKTGLAYA